MPAATFTLHCLHPHAVRRAFIAGGAWGIMLAAGLTGLTLAECGAVCLDDLAFTTATSVLVGIIGIGPLAALGRDGR